MSNVIINKSAGDLFIGLEKRPNTPSFVYSQGTKAKQIQEKLIWIDKNRNLFSFSSNLDLNAACVFVANSGKEFIFQMGDDKVFIIQFNRNSDQTQKKIRIGNIEVFQISEQGGSDFSEYRIEDLSIDTLSHVQYWLVAGQTINLSKFKSVISGLKEGADQTPFIRYLRYLDEIIKHSNYAKLVFNEAEFGKEPVVHQTAAFKEIEDSKSIRVSSGGCLGKCSYTTRCSVDNTGVLSLKNHGKALHKRLADKGTGSGEDVILAYVNPNANFLTNWIERFRAGGIHLRAKQILIGDSSLAPQEIIMINKANKMAFEQAKELLNLANYIDLANINLDTVFSNDLDGLFRRVVSEFETNRKVSSEFMNNILFEMLKDYALLYPMNPVSDQWNLEDHYDLVFSLCPEMRKNFFVDKFDLPIEVMIQKMTEKGFFNKDGQIEIFKKFFIRAAYNYINVKSFNKLTQRSVEDYTISRSLDFEKRYPNIMGLLFCLNLKKISSIENGGFFQAYQKIFFDELEKSLEQSQVHLRIKSGLFWTDEVGLSQSASISHFAHGKLQEDGTQYTIVPQRKLDFSLSGNSVNRTGFTGTPPQ